MKHLLFIFSAVFLFATATGFAQNQNLKSNIVFKDTVASKPYTLNPLAPAKAAFYSAVIPGLGQAYNKQYWKVPLVYGGMALSLYYYNFNNRKYHEYRDAYKDKLAGKQLTGDLANYNEDQLIRVQKFHEKNRDLSMLITVGVYILNIVDANVYAHLRQFNVNDNLSLEPALQQNGIDNRYNMGLSLSYKF